MEEQGLKMIYGIEAEIKGLENAYKEAMKNIDKFDKETLKEYKKEVKKEDAKFLTKMANIQIKLFYISNSLLFHNMNEVKKCIPLFMEDLRGIIEDLEGEVNECIQ